MFSSTRPSAQPSDEPSASARVSHGPAGLWTGVDYLIDRAPRMSDLWEHRVHLLAARRWRELGREIPPELLFAEQRAKVATLTAPVLLEKVRDAVDTPLLLLKGPEVAARYPDPAMRPFGDLDLLTLDADAIQRALVSAGFQEVGKPEYFVGIHHLRPLSWPGLPLVIEIHARPKWVGGFMPPPPEELFEAAVESSLGVEGVLAPSDAHHALVIAAHSWAHEPLGRLLEIIDVAAMSEGVDRSEIEAVARRWEMGRIWHHSIAAADALFSDRRSNTLALRLWARNLQGVRGRTVLEAHLEDWIGRFWIDSVRQALPASARAVAQDLRRIPGETWSNKLVRTILACRNAFMRRSEHNRLAQALTREHRPPPDA